MTLGPVQLPMTIEQHSDEAMIHFGGRGGGMTPEALKLELEHLVAARPARVSLDLSDVAQISGVLLGIILTLRRGVVGYGGQIRIVAAQPIVLELFRRTGLDIVFDTGTGIGVWRACGSGR
jgi:anti-anti-sigma factor